MIVQKHVTEYWTVGQQTGKDWFLTGLEFSSKAKAASVAKEYNEKLVKQGITSGRYSNQYVPLKVVSSKIISTN